MAEIELHPGTASCDIATLNRLVQQQQLGIPIARALIYDEICQAVVLSQDDSDELVDVSRPAGRGKQRQCRPGLFANPRLSFEDLSYISSRWEQIERFQNQVFAEEVERQFLSTKLSHDQVTYSMIRVRDEIWPLNCTNACWMTKPVLLNSPADSPKDPNATRRCLRPRALRSGPYGCCGEAPQLPRGRTARAVLSGGHLADFAPRVLGGCTAERRHAQNIARRLI